MTDSTPAPTHQCGLRPIYTPAQLPGTPSTVLWLREYLQRHGGLEGETLSELPDRGEAYLRRLPCLDRLIVQWSDHPSRAAPMGFLRRIAPDHWHLLLCSEPPRVMELSTEEAHNGIRVLHPISLTEWGRMEMGGIAAWGGELGIDHHSPDPGGFNTVARNEPLPTPPPESPAPVERRGESDGRRAGDGEGGAGRKLDSGKEPFGLLPWIALTWVARTLDYGAKKYSSRGACTCSVNAGAKPTPRGNAETATTKHSVPETRTTPPDSGPHPPLGTENTPKPSSGFTSRSGNESASATPLTRSAPYTDMPGRSGNSFPRTMTPLSPAVAPSAGVQSGSVSTTTTPQGSSAGASATPATSGSASSSAPTDGLSEHSPTCGVHTVRSGAGNWRKVPQASDRYFDAALRHLVAWRQGEAMDAESGLPHLACAACCVLFLLELEHPDPRAPQSPTSAGPIGR